MSALQAIAVDVKAIPADCLIRHVPRAVYAEDEETVLRTEIDTPEASYCWLVEKDGAKVYVSGDHSLPCILGGLKEGEADPVVARLTKLHPKTGVVKYGPADVTESQYASWVSAGIEGL
jgi:hypothetical protein